MISFMHVIELVPLKFQMILLHQKTPGQMLGIAVISLILIFQNPSMVESRAQPQGWLTEDDLESGVLGGAAPAAASLNSNSLVDRVGNSINSFAALADAFNAATANFATAADDHCDCVPYYQCPNGTHVVDGAGLIDIR